MTNTVNGEVYTVKCEEGFEKVQKVFEKIDESMESLVKASSSWDPQKNDATQCGPKLKMKMQQVVQLIPENIVVEELDEAKRMEIYLIVLESIGNMIDNLSKFAGISLEDTKNDILNIFNINMNTFLENLRKKPVNLAEKSETLKKKSFQKLAFLNHKT